MPFLQNAQDVHINHSEFTDIRGDYYVQNGVTSTRGRRGPHNRIITDNHYDFSRGLSDFPEVMNAIRGLSGNERPPGGNNFLDSRHMSPRSFRNDTNDVNDMYIGTSSRRPPAGERGDNRGHRGQLAATSNVNPASSINFTRQFSSSRPEEHQSSASSPDSTGAQIDSMNDGGSRGPVLINNSTFAIAGRSINRNTVASQAPLSQTSPKRRHEDDDTSFTGRYRDPTSCSITSESPVPRVSPTGTGQTTLDDRAASSRQSTNVPRPEVSINEALKEPPSNKDAGFLGF